MIPKLIHQVWLGSDVPVKFMGAMGDWALLNPEWRYQLWTQPPYGMVNEELYWDANLYVKPDAVWQFRADLVRYEVLYRHGGFYADADTKPLRPLGNLLDGLSEFAVAEDANWISNTYLAAEPEHPIFDALIQDQLARASGFSQAAAGVVSGPQYMTPIWSTMGGHVDMRTELWHPYGWEDVRRGRDKRVLISPDAYAIHSWQHSRDKMKQWAKTARDNKRLGDV